MTISRWGKKEVLTLGKRTVSLPLDALRNGVAGDG